jgi:hypothetical protein
MLGRVLGRTQCLGTTIGPKVPVPCRVEARLKDTWKENEVPRPSLLSMTMEPPIFSTKVLAIESPRPAPFALALPSAPRRYGWNICATYNGARALCPAE